MSLSYHVAIECEGKLLLALHAGSLLHLEKGHLGESVFILHLRDSQSQITESISLARLQKLKRFLNRICNMCCRLSA